ncbi:MAG: DUF4197 domain-containing protein [Desulfobacteraceae bacterium]|nr:DUF4197 domain-containing protein [Desulfobacteraceae bacterium]
MKVVRMTLVFLVMLGTAIAASAATNWLQKGTDTLKSLDTGGEGTSVLGANLPNSDVIAGLKEALTVGSEHVVQQLGQTDGFYADPQIRIPLPEKLATVKSALDKVGMGSFADDLELKLNRAAEAATPRARELFLNAISQMTFEDARGILNGPEDAATQYFKKTMSPDLAQAMTPVVDDSLSEVGAVQSYDRMMGKYADLPFVPDVKANLTDHVVNKGMDGIFHYMAVEEAAIRKNPVKRTTDLLKKVFQ